MPTFTSMAGFGRELDRLGAELRGAEKRRITSTMAERARRIAEQEIVADVGPDRRFSGWPAQLQTQIRRTRTNAAILHPTRQGAGPITVANQGRNRGNAGGFAGPGVNRRTGSTAASIAGGSRRVRAFKQKRWNGVTAPMHTADRAVVRMEREMPRIAEDGFRRVLRRHFDVT